MRVALALVALFAIIGSALAVEESYFQQKFIAFQQEHGKTYSTDEFQARYQTFKSNVQFIDAHNAAGAATYTVGINEFADLSNEEFSALYKGYAAAARPARSTPAYIEPSIADLPASVDWREKGAVTAIKNQGQCGSCWSFSTTGSTSSAYFLAGGKLNNGVLTPLSEQNLMDCSTSYGNQGCNGGLMDNAFKYIIANGGIDTEASYPYTAADGTCHYNAANSGATISSYQDIPQGSVSGVHAAVAEHPISIAVNAAGSGWQFYSGGVFSASASQCNPQSLDHGVGLVGYKSVNGVTAGILRNSWGSSWGLEGYMLINLESNTCGLAEAASYPIV